MSDIVDRLEQAAIDEGPSPAGRLYEEAWLEVKQLRAALRNALDAIIKMDGLGDDDGAIAENAEKAIRAALDE